MEFLPLHDDSVEDTVYSEINICVQKQCMHGIAKEHKEGMGERNTCSPSPIRNMAYNILVSTYYCTFLKARQT